MSTAPSSAHDDAVELGLVVGGVGQEDEVDHPGHFAEHGHAAPDQGASRAKVSASKRSAGHGGPPVDGAHSPGSGATQGLERSMKSSTGSSRM